MFKQCNQNIFCSSYIGVRNIVMIIKRPPVVHWQGPTLSDWSRTRQVLYYWTIETLWTEDDHNGRMSFCSSTLLLDNRDTLNRWSQWQNVILFKCSTTRLLRHSEQKMITMAECHSVQILYYWTIETLWTEDDHNGRMSFCSSALLLDYWDTLNRRWSQWQNVILFKCSTTGLSRHSEQKMITMAECHSVQVLYYWTIETLWTDDHNGRMSI